MGDFEINLVLPVISLAAYGVLAMLLVPLLRASSRWLGAVSLIGMGMAGVFLVDQWLNWRLFGIQETAYGLVRVDGFGLYFSFIVLLVGILTVLYSMSFLERESADHGEFYPLVLFCLAGMIMMLQTNHLMMVLIGLEVFSLSLYVLTGLTRMRLYSVEAALKYFLLGAFSSSFMVYGMALLYGATGSLDMARIGEVVATNPSRMLWIGTGLLLIGLFFKVAVVPFHQWVPDVYTGAPTNVTGFMAAATKTVAIAVLLRFLVGAFASQSEIWIPMVTWLAILTMTVGNLIALAQTNLKRMLAYSSIAHAGYLLIGVVSMPESGVRAIMFYLTAYAIITVGAFAALSAVGRGDAEHERGYQLSDWAGLGWERPMLGAAMAFFLFSLAGMPPTGGFFGKFVIFQSAIESGHYMLAIVGMLNATIAIYYYLRVIVMMYMTDPETDEFPLPVTAASAVVMVVSIIGVLYLGLAPGNLLTILSNLASSL